MKPRDLALRLHRWGGLAAGLVVWALSLTGAVLIVSLPAGLRSVHVTDPITPGEAEPLPASAIIDSALAELRARRVTSIELHRDPTRAAVLQLPDGSTAFVNPWTGRVVATRDLRGSAIFTELHTQLALGEVGRAVVVAATIAFVLIISLGLWLWWPAHRRFRRAFTIRANRGLKRLNYDLHNVLGFYAALMLLLLSGTGILMSFPRLMNLGARAAAVALPEPGGLVTPAGSTKPGTAGNEGGNRTDEPLVDRALAHGARLFPDAPWLRAVALPGSPARFRVLAAASEGFDRAHTVRIDAEGGLVGVVEYGEERIALQFSRWVNQVHTARLGNGYPVLAFLACAVGTFLPLTGVLIWFPRWRRSRSRARADDGR